MKKYLELVNKLKWFIVIIIPVIVMLLASNLKNLEIDGSYRIWFEENSKILTDYDDFRNNFSNDDGIVVIFQDTKGIFNKKALETIQRITEAFWDMPHIDRVNSLTNYQYVHSDKSRPDEVLVEDFIEEDLSNINSTYFEDRKKAALADEIILDSYISRDGTTTMIFARLEPNANEDQDISAEMMKAVHKIIDPEEKRTGYKFWLNGGPPMTEAFVQIAGQDAMTFTPLVALLSFILLWLVFRKLSGALIPLLVVIFTFLTVIAIQTMLGYKLNNFTANIPVFVIAIGIADAVHIYSIWLMRRKDGSSNFDAVHYTIDKNFLAILLTSMTTTIGFMSLSFSKIVPVSTLGIATASAAVLAFIISIVWMPSILLLLKKEMKGTEKDKDIMTI